MAELDPWRVFEALGRAMARREGIEVRLVSVQRDGVELPRGGEPPPKKS